MLVSSVTYDSPFLLCLFVESNMPFNTHLQLKSHYIYYSLRPLLNCMHNVKTGNNVTQMCEIIHGTTNIFIQNWENESRFVRTYITRNMTFSSSGSGLIRVSTNIKIYVLFWPRNSEGSWIFLHMLHVEPIVDWQYWKDPFLCNVCYPRRSRLSWLSIIHIKRARKNLNFKWITEWIHASRRSF